LEDRDDRRLGESRCLHASKVTETVNYQVAEERGSLQTQIGRVCRSDRVNPLRIRTNHFPNYQEIPALPELCATLGHRFT
jgi:hypothetical protein